MPNPDLQSICDAFDFAGRCRSAKRWGSGHINDTWAVETTDRRYLLQRLNPEVFPDPVAVMENIRRVTDHLAAKPTPGTPLSLVPSRAGEIFHRDAAGNTWRAYPFIERARSYDVVPDAAIAREGARTFGQFLKDLDDLPEPPLIEAIPGFHHTPGRYAEFSRACDEDPLGRAREVRVEAAFARDREEITGVLEAAREAGEMPVRVTHNDTKINNVLFDEATGEGVTVVDLDTVMPGVALYDFGDLVRTCVCPAAGDERDLTKVTVRPEIYDALVEGYTLAMGDLLTDTERRLMFFSATLITFETGLRFLTDYLRGDRYFRTSRARQNLDRARMKFELVRRLEQVDPS